MQANFRIKFNFKNYPPKSNIRKQVTKFQATGTIHHLNCKADGSKSERKNIAKKKYTKKNEIKKTAKKK